MKRCPGAMVILLAASSFATAGNWPGWRGPTGDGHTPEKDLPLTWSPTQNVRWKIPLPADGNSTPAVWGNCIFFTQATVGGKKRALHCLDRATGKEFWKREIPFEGKETTHGTNPYCSASPITDGERVVVSHGSAGMFCYDFTGKELWKKELGVLEHIWGNASSPIFYKDLVILWCGPGERQFLLAVNKNNGGTVWEHKEAGGHSGTPSLTAKEMNVYLSMMLQRPRLGAAASSSFFLAVPRSVNWIGSWSTPIVARIGDHDELILSVPNKVKGFDPASGKELWFCSGLTNLVYTSPVCSSDGIVLAFSGYGGSALAVRAGGKGDVTTTHRHWHHPSNPQRIGSAVIRGEHVYLYNEQGLMNCFELKTGKDLWNRARVGGPSWSSLVAAGDRFYMLTEAGATLVIEPGEKPKVVAQNRLGEMARASIVVSDGELFIRTYKHLWCIADKKEKWCEPFVSAGRSWQWGQVHKEESLDARGVDKVYVAVGMKVHARTSALIHQR